jgi:TrmH RNA methyltransferase
MEAMKGKMIRIGTSLDATKSVGELSSLKQADGSIKPFLIVLGNEETGISDVIKNNCDELIIIPWAGMEKGKECKIDSLNVAQASSIIFSEVMKTCDC